MLALVRGIRAVCALVTVVSLIYLVMSLASGVLGAAFWAAVLFVASSFIGTRAHAYCILHGVDEDAYWPRRSP